MEDKLSSLGLSFDRVLIQLIVPGLTALFPYIFLFLHCCNTTEEIKFMRENINLEITVVTLLALIVGLFLENFGSIIEVHWYDKKNLQKDDSYFRIWEKFLCLNYKGHEPVGHRYLRNILLRMKFELSFALALIIMSIGLIIWDYNQALIASFWIKLIVLCLLPISGAIYLLVKEAYASSCVLAKTRKILVEKYQEL